MSKHSEIMTLETFRERINSYLDFIEAEVGDDSIVVLGSWLGTFEFAGETDTYPASHRIRGNLGYSSSMFDPEAWDAMKTEKEVNSGDVPIRRAFTDSRFNALMGTAILPGDLASEEARSGLESEGVATFDLEGKR